MKLAETFNHPGLLLGDKFDYGVDGESILVILEKAGRWGAIASAAVAKGRVQSSLGDG